MRERKKKANESGIKKPHQIYSNTPLYLQMQTYINISLLIHSLSQQMGTIFIAASLENCCRSVQSSASTSLTNNIIREMYLPLAVAASPET